MVLLLYAEKLAIAVASQVEKKRWVEQKRYDYVWDGWHVFDMFVSVRRMSIECTYVYVYMYTYTYVYIYI